VLEIAHEAVRELHRQHRSAGFERAEVRISARSMAISRCPRSSRPALICVMYGVAAARSRSMRRDAPAVARFRREREIRGSELIARAYAEAHGAFVAFGDLRLLRAIADDFERRVGLQRHCDRRVSPEPATLFDTPTLTSNSSPGVTVVGAFG
jgi:hypothetical protein